MEQTFKIISCVLLAFSALGWLVGLAHGNDEGCWTSPIEAPQSHDEIDSTPAPGYVYSPRLVEASPESNFLGNAYCPSLFQKSMNKVCCSAPEYTKMTDDNSVFHYIEQTWWRSPKCLRVMNKLHCFGGCHPNQVQFARITTNGVKVVAISNAGLGQFFEACCSEPSPVGYLVNQKKLTVCQVECLKQAKNNRRDREKCEKSFTRELFLANFNASSFEKQQDASISAPVAFCLAVETTERNQGNYYCPAHRLYFNTTVDHLFETADMEMTNSNSNKTTSSQVIHERQHAVYWNVNKIIIVNISISVLAIVLLVLPFIPCLQKWRRNPHCRDAFAILPVLFLCALAIYMGTLQPSLADEEAPASQQLASTDSQSYRQMIEFQRITGMPHRQISIIFTGQSKSLTAYFKDEIASSEAQLKQIKVMKGGREITFDDVCVRPSPSELGNKGPCYIDSPLNCIHHNLTLLDQLSDQELDAILLNCPFQNDYVSHSRRTFGASGFEVMTIPLLNTEDAKVWEKAAEDKYLKKKAAEKQISYKTTGSDERTIDKNFKKVVSTATIWLPWIVDGLMLFSVIGITCYHYHRRKVPAGPHINVCVYAGVVFFACYCGINYLLFSSLSRDGGDDRRVMFAELTTLVLVIVQVFMVKANISSGCTFLFWLRGLEIKTPASNAGENEPINNQIRDVEYVKLSTMICQDATIRNILLATTASDLIFVFVYMLQNDNPTHRNLYAKSCMQVLMLLGKAVTYRCLVICVMARTGFKADSSKTKLSNIFKKISDESKQQWRQKGEKIFASLISTIFMVAFFVSLFGFFLALVPFFPLEFQGVNLSNVLANDEENNKITNNYYQNLARSHPLLASPMYYVAVICTDEDENNIVYHQELLLNVSHSLQILASDDRSTIAIPPVNLAEELDYYYSGCCRVRNKQADPCPQLHQDGDCFYCSNIFGPKFPSGNAEIAYKLLRNAFHQPPSLRCQFGGPPSGLPIYFKVFEENSQLVIFHGYHKPLTEQAQWREAIREIQGLTFASNSCSAVGFTHGSAAYDTPDWYGNAGYEFILWSSSAIAWLCVVLFFGQCLIPEFNELNALLSTLAMAVSTILTVAIILAGIDGELTAISTPHATVGAFLAAFMSSNLVTFDWSQDVTPRCCLKLFAVICIVAFSSGVVILVMKFCDLPYYGGTIRFSTSDATILVLIAAGCVGTIGAAMFAWATHILGCWVGCSLSRQEAIVQKKLVELIVNSGGDSECVEKLNAEMQKLRGTIEASVSVRRLQLKRRQLVIMRHERRGETLLNLAIEGGTNSGRMVEGLLKNGVPVSQFKGTLTAAHFEEGSNLKPNREVSEMLRQKGAKVSGSFPPAGPPPLPAPSPPAPGPLQNIGDQGGDVVPLQNIGDQGGKVVVPLQNNDNQIAATEV